MRIRLEQIRESISDALCTASGAENIKSFVFLYIPLLGMSGTDNHESLFMIIPSPKWNHFDTCTKQAADHTDSSSMLLRPIQARYLQSDGSPPPRCKCTYRTPRRVPPVSADQEHIVAARNGFIGHVAKIHLRHGS